MAANFEITIDKNCDGYGLNLKGDFDATSAYELIYAIKRLPEEARMINVFTNGLRSIHPFGLDVFHKFIQSPKSDSARIVFNGKHAFRISNPGLASVQPFPARPGQNFKPAVLPG
jgi:hypothetical protein